MWDMDLTAIVVLSALGWLGLVFLCWWTYKAWYTYKYGKWAIPRRRDRVKKEAQ